MFLKQTLTMALALAAFGLTAGAARAQGYHERMLHSWYVNYLGRPVDPAGWHDHLRALGGGASPLLVEAEILGSLEYYRRNGATPEGFIAGLFHDVLGVEPTPPEFHYWLRRTQRDSRSEVAADFLREMRAGAAPPVRVPGPPPYSRPPPSWR